MFVTQGGLADGRPIYYYSDVAATRPPVDARILSPASTRGELRFDRLREEWVAIAGHRNERTFLPTQQDCPLCPSRGSVLTEVPAADYEVVVFENRFPSFAGPDGPVAGGDFPTRPAAGGCEVVCFTSDHTGAFADLSASRARLVIDAWADRTRALSQREGVEQVFVFENRGAEIGVTLSHPHGQIYAYPFLTPRTRQDLAAARRYADATGGSLYDDIVAAEIRAGVRMVAQSSHWVAFVPFAARWPIEIHAYPRRRVPDLAALDDAERHDLAGIYLELLSRLDRFFDDADPLPYIAAWHQAPIHHDRDSGALHLELLSIRRAPGRVKYLAGSESVMGAFVNDRSPEHTAARLRDLA